MRLLNLSANSLELRNIHSVDPVISEAASERTLKLIQLFFLCFLDVAFALMFNVYRPPLF